MTHVCIGTHDCLYIQAKCWAKYTIPDAHKANDEISVEKQRSIQAEGEYCPPLTMGALKRHDLQTSCELHQFRCPNCFRWWWKTVPEFKPVCKCRICKICLNPLKPLERFGVGRFVCPCGNVFFCRCQASDSRKCDNCGRILHKPYIRPYFRIESHMPITPEQQYPYESTNAPTGHGYYYYPSSTFSPYAGPFSHPAMNATMYDLPRRHSTLRDFFPPEFYMGDSRYFAANSPPHEANPVSMHPPPFTTGGLLPTLVAGIIYPPSAVSFQNSSIDVGSTLCTANSHAASLVVQSPAAYHTSERLQGQPRFSQSLVPALPAPVCTSDCSTTSGETTMAVSLCDVLPDLDYVPPETLVIPSSNQLLPTTSAAPAPVPLASGDASVPGEATAIPSCSSSISLTSASENSLQGNPQPPLTSSSTSGPLPIFPSAVSSDPDPLKPAVSNNTQPQLNSSSASEHFSMPLDNVLTDLHLAETSCTQPQSETSVDVPVTLISPLQPASPTSINPPLAIAETTAEATANVHVDTVCTGVLVKTTHVSSEKPRSDVDYNPPETTAIPSLGDSQSDLPDPKHRDSSQAESGADTLSLAAATNSDQSLTEPGTPTLLKVTTAAEASNTVHSPTTQMDATAQTEVKMANITLNPPQVSSIPPSSSSPPHLSQQVGTVSTPQATVTKFEPKAEPTTTPPLSVNFANIHGTSNPAAGATAGSVPYCPPHQARNDQWTSYYDHRVRIHMNPRDLKYKQVSTRHNCSGSTIGTDIVPQLSDHYRNTKLKMHQVHRHMNRNQCEYSPDLYDLDYDLMEVSSEEEDED